MCTMPALVPVESSNLKAVGYEPGTKALTVQFKSGAQHVYEGVPAHEHARLMASDSIGSHFHANIKSAYKSSKLHGDAA